MTASNKAIVIAPLQTRGGTGKTTVIMSLAGAYAVKDKRVLVVDLDSNAALTQDLGYTISNPRKCSSDYIRTERDLTDNGCIFETNTPNLHIIPNYEGYEEKIIRSTLENEARISNVDVDGFVRGALKRILEPLLEHYDYIFLDTVSKSDALLTEMALAASDYVFITTRPKSSDAPKLQGAIRFIEKAREDGNPNIQFLGIPLTWIRRGATFEKDREIISKGIHEALVPFLFESTLRDSEALIKGARTLSVPPSAIPDSHLHVGSAYGKEEPGKIYIGNSKGDGTSILDDIHSLASELEARIEKKFFEKNRATYEKFLDYGDSIDWQFRPNEVVKVVE